MIEGKKNPKQRYILLFTDLFICTTKLEDALVFEWKVDLCNSEIEILKKGKLITLPILAIKLVFTSTIDKSDLEYIKTISQKKITNYPFTLKVC